MQRENVTERRVSGSVGSTLKSMLARSRVNPRDPRSPTTTPATISRIPCPTTKPRTWNVGAPRAMRMPSSLSRWVTVKARRPYRPMIARIKARAANTPQQAEAKPFRRLIGWRFAAGPFDCGMAISRRRDSLRSCDFLPRPEGLSRRVGSSHSRYGRPGIGQPWGVHQRVNRSDMARFDRASLPAFI